MTSTTAPKVSRRPSVPLIWVVPIVAIGIGGWMAYQEFHNMGPEIAITFSDGSGLEAGRTQIVYKGVSVGSVKSVRLKPDLDGVVVNVRMLRGDENLAREGSQFWIVHPEIGFSGVKGLDTLVSGVRLGVLPGKGPLTRQFRGLDQAPPPEIVDQGRSYLLQSSRLGSLTSGAPVFYRELKVGSVESSRLAPDSATVLIRIHVDGPYVNLVRTNTRFWNTGGFSFKLSLLGGAQFKDTSLESLVDGGVAFATPDTPPLAPVADDGEEFDLASEPQKEWTNWSPKIPIHSPESALLANKDQSLLSPLLKP